MCSYEAHTHIMIKHVKYLSKLFQLKLENIFSCIKEILEAHITYLFIYGLWEETNTGAHTCQSRTLLLHHEPSSTSEISTYIILRP